MDHGSANHARTAFQLLSTLRFEHGRCPGPPGLLGKRIGHASPDPVARSASLAGDRPLPLLEPQEAAPGRRDGARARALARKVGHRFAVPSSGCSRRGGEEDAAVAHSAKAHQVANLHGDRFFAFYALEQHAMLELDRGRPLEAGLLGEEMVRLGERIREGSEASFAHLVVELAAVAAGDEGRRAALVACIERLDDEDARFRVGYAQTRTSALDLAAGRPEEALVRAREGLRAAEMLRRPSEVIHARVALARAARALADADGVAEQQAALASGALGVVARDVVPRPRPIETQVVHSGRGGGS
ncbi:MAG: hypothetical protein H6732_14215 [Alphaproteobacteria bacterium]|nr:hypothetical protein [Alphaproteobacteria bacterium]